MLCVCLYVCVCVLAHEGTCVCVHTLHTRHVRVYIRDIRQVCCLYDITRASFPEKVATTRRALLRKMTIQDQAPHVSLPLYIYVTGAR